VLGYTFEVIGNVIDDFLLILCHFKSSFILPNVANQRRGIPRPLNLPG